MRRREFLPLIPAAFLTREARASRRSDGGPVIDLHAHWHPEPWLKLVEDNARAEGVSIKQANGSIQISGPTWAAAAIDANTQDLGQRLEKMDSRGVDVQVLSLTNPMVHWASPAFGAKLARLFNDLVSGAHQEHPRRYYGLATLPVQAPDLAVQELERASKLPGIRGIYLPTSVAGKDLDHPSLAPLFARCEALGWPVGLHPSEIIGRERLMNRFYFQNLIGNPYETGVAAASLIAGGVLDAHPRLEIILPHAGGVFPSLIGRLDRGAAVRPELRNRKQPFSAYLHRFTYDTIAHSDELLGNLIRLVGAGRVVLGSDYPYDMGYERPVEVVERLAGLSAADRDRILGGTAARLLHI